jgi:hypothetical protein
MRQGNLSELLHWEQVVLEQAQHYRVVPLVLINLKGCPPDTHTQQLVESVKVGWIGLGLWCMGRVVCVHSLLWQCVIH